MQDRKLRSGWGSWLALWLCGKQLWGTLGWVSLAGAIATWSTPVEAAELTQWQFNDAAKQLEVTVPAGVKPRYFILAQPARIVLELPNTQVGTVPTQRSLTGSVREVRVSQFQPDVTRIVMQLAPEAVFAPGQVELKQVAENRWVVRPLLVGSEASTATTAPVTATPQAATKPPEVRSPQTSAAAPNSTPAKTPTAPPAATKPTPQPTPTKPQPTVTPPASTSVPAPQPQPAATVPPTLPAAPATPAVKPTVTAPVLTVRPVAPTAIAPQTRQEPTWEPLSPPSSETNPQQSPQPVAQSPQTTAIAPSTSPAVTPPISTRLETQGVAPDAIDTALPPATFTEQRPVTVRVPSRQSRSTTSSQPNRVVRQQPAPSQSIPVVVSPPSTPMASDDFTETALPPATIAPSSTATVKVPPLRSVTQPEIVPSVATPAPTTPSDVVVGRVVEFGQPLPSTSTTAPSTASSGLPNLEPQTTLPPEMSAPSVTGAPTVTVPPLRSQPNNAPQARIERSSLDLPTSITASGDGVLLPAGTQLILQYPGAEPLVLKPGVAQQEVLLLQTEVRDRNGAVVIPRGAQVIGRFESDRGGSRFIAQAISLRGQNVPFAAKSTALDGKLQVSEDKVVKHSALGAIAGALVGGVSGGDILGGAAAGAAVTYLTAPKPATLQPGQLIQVQVTEDLR